MRGVAEDGDAPAELADERCRPSGAPTTEASADVAPRTPIVRPRSDGRRCERHRDEHADERESIAEDGQAAERERRREAPGLAEQHASASDAQQPQGEHRFSPKRRALIPAGTLSSIASRPYSPVNRPSCV